MKHAREAALGVICLTIAATAQAQNYELSEIGPVADQSASLPAAINNGGDVSGTSGGFAFRYSNGAKEILGSLPGGTISRGLGINSSGDVVGDSSLGSSAKAGTHATFFVKGEAYDLGTLPKFGNYSVAQDVNDQRQVVGYAGPASDSVATRAFIWDQTNGIRPLGTLGGDYSQALAISNTRYITGNAQLVSGSPVRHAFLQHPKGDSMRDLGTLGGASSYGTFVNDQAHVVGYSEVASRDETKPHVHAFIYNGAAMIDLGTLNSKSRTADRSMAFGVNGNDEVVGTTDLDYNGTVVPVAFVYRNGTMLDLNTLVRDLGPYRLQSATAINDAGLIVAQAINQKTNVSRAVLLTPVYIR